jgi:hypothetical protein
MVMSWSALAYEIAEWCDLRQALQWIKHQLPPVKNEIERGRQLLIEPRDFGLQIQLFKVACYKNPLPLQVYGRWMPLQLYGRRGNLPVASVTGTKLFASYSQHEEIPTAKLNTDSPSTRYDYNESTISRVWHADTDLNDAADHYPGALPCEAFLDEDPGDLLRLERARRAWQYIEVRAATMDLFMIFPPSDARLQKIVKEFAAILPTMSPADERPASCVPKVSRTTRPPVVREAVLNWLQNLIEKDGLDAVLKCSNSGLANSYLAADPSHRGEHRTVCRIISDWRNALPRGN